MTSETQDNAGTENQSSKEEHIKQRLKEMGVSEDSERPKKSFISKYGKYAFLVVIAVLVIAYGYEYNKQSQSSETQLAKSGDMASNQPVAAYAYSQPMSPMEHPAWVKERQAKMPERPEPPAWVKERRAQMQQPPEPPAWVQERRNMWLQQQQAMMNPGISQNGNDNRTENGSSYPAQRYPVYPGPYWQNYPRYYPNMAYGHWPAYPVPYGGGYPYYNGW